MKRLITLFVAVIMLCSFSVACDNQKPDDGKKSAITIYMPDGAPVLSMYELLKTVDQLDGHEVSYQIVSGADAVGTAMLNGDADIAVMPTNIAAKLYNNGAKIKLLSVNVFGVLYMVGKTPLENGLNDLLGKVVLNIGQGGSPDITLKYILDSNDIPYEVSDTPVDGKVALRYVSAASEVIPLLKTDQADYGILGEPAATNAVNKIPAQSVLDLQEIWNNALGEDSFTQAGVVVSQEVAADSGLIEALLQKLQSNLTYVYADAANISETIQEYGSTLSVEFTSDILTRCNLKCQKASLIKDKIEAYYNAVKTYDQSFIGGKLPDDGFYY